MKPAATQSLHRTKPSPGMLWPSTAQYANSLLSSPVTAAAAEVALAEMPAGMPTSSASEIAPHATVVAHGPSPLSSEALWGKEKTQVSMAKRRLSSGGAVSPRK